MAGAKTWDVDRKKGGTFSFKLDAQGNYTLQKDGFGSVKTLNLPELKKEDTKTTITKDTKTASDQTKKAFGDVQPFYYRGGGADSNEQYINEYKIKKDKSLDTDQSEPAGAWDKGQWGPKPGDTSGAWDQGQWGPQPSKGAPISTVDKARKDAGTFISKIDDKSTAESGMQFTDPSPTKVDQQQKQIDKFGTGQWGPKQSSGMPVPDKFAQSIGPQEVNIPKKQTLPQTVLKNVTTSLKPLANAVGFVMNPIMGVGRMIAGAVSPEQKQLNERNSSALGALGYKTRGELGSNTDPGRIAGNPANNVFAGMNAQSMTGNVFNGARKRVATRTKTAEKNKNKWSKEKLDNFNAKTKEFKGQIQEAQGKKNQQDMDKGPGHYGPAGGGGNGGGGGGRVICTELHSTGEMSTVDWIRDTRFTFKTLTKSHVKGYLFWAIPTVRHMKKYPLYRKIWKHIAQHRANDIAWRLGESKFDLLGRIYAGIGEPTCWLIGKFVSDKQYNELNLKNWRKA